MFTTRGSEFITFNNKLYQVYRKISTTVIKDEHIQDVKEMWHCDIVLKTKNQDKEIFLFLVEVTDVIEELD